jgi:YHS domain-containing protein
MQVRQMGFGIAIALGVLAGRAEAQQKVLVNVDKQGVALEGYDPVAFFSDSRAMKGSPTYQAHVGGATYYFSSADHLATFQQEPARYTPQFGGYCAYGASQGHVAPVEISTWQILDGRLTLNYSKDVQQKFNQDVPGYLAKANAQWPRLIESEGKVRD